MNRSARSLWTKKISEGGADKLQLGSTGPLKGAKSAQHLGGGHKSPHMHKWGGEQICGKVLGIDPSLRGTGLAVIESGPDGSLRYIDSITVRNTPKMTMPQCLARIFLETQLMIRRHKPICAAIEQCVYVQNFKTALILGSSRGAAIAALAGEGLEVFDYPPLRIKQAVIGYGRASKEQVAKSVAALVGNAGILPSDEADAAGAAIAHIFTHKS